ncbi:MAG: phosphate ABC transporter permease subunit PstC [Anaeroplasma sp.]
MEKIDKDKIVFKSKADVAIKLVFMIITIICSLTIIIITLFILIKGVAPFVKKYTIGDQQYSASIGNFLFGTTWFKSPNLYGAGYIIINTIYVTLISLIIAVPISILTALFISKIAPNSLSKLLNYVIEMLASIPSVIYGLFGAGVITKLVKSLSKLLGFQSAGGISVLSASLVLAIMIIPTITMLSVTAINAVKKDLIHGSLALGASKTQTNFKVVLASAKSGIFSGIILGVGRALGEATAVSMVCGNSDSGPNLNPFDITKTLTSGMLLGIHESTGLSYDIRFSLGIVLIVIILITNLGLNAIKNRIGKVNAK